ncbi:MAG: hypothetical protein A3B10_03575 [Candidatus Doudnabacteria bacterium RIFCSPLOWO2_01_FULL_44_21]|uniref:HTH arsR-type domain-containing protein n=1 Tax=Candidatus Doudnabacteria bacterium RIFCSPLOWO2_01_FULL_44_21 TaxID=1817841 RepID=A0A1F5PY55_9BACT|nr:MAG: hypothetical protein A3B95_02270 [Candidatus Doudnabacteria bacterium RIFCSPHIGHO2_02_FULL_43_13b]OGE94843.1 MAG: hypothetical protein A3B10_03575 [Candidatus Doudnabacteria bacterium RIFCSPLOWO2_01_FULL_44_21]
MKNTERILKALANRRRLAIVRYLRDRREASVGEIAEAIRLSFRATSKHLIILLAVDILEKDQRSLQMYYRLSDDRPKLATQIITMV